MTTFIIIALLAFAGGTLFGFLACEAEVSTARNAEAIAKRRARALEKQIRTLLDT
jgi:hypothetical protein